MNHSRKSVGKFFVGIGDLISTMSITPVGMYFDEDQIGFNFHTSIHEYTIGFEDGEINLVVWHGSGESDIAEGSLNETTWEAIKEAIKKQDEECEFCNRKSESI